VTDPAAGFRLVGVRTLLDVSFLTVERLHLRDPGGAPVARIRVRHPGAVAVVPVDGDDVLLIEQYRAPVERALLEIPAGKLDLAGEDPETAARRELEEEIGRRTDRLDHLTTIFTTPGFSDERIIIYRSGALEPVPRDPVGAEEAASRLVRMPLQEAVRKVHDGEIVDAKTVIALLLVARGR